MAKLDDVYMGTAILHQAKSRALRAKVGAVIVTKTGVIIPGYNGTPAGTDNTCEDKVWHSYEGPWGDSGEYVTVTKPTVIHAELNCVLKAAKEGISVDGAKVYVTLSPCLSCSAMLIQVGISEVIYKEEYRDTSGIDYLRENGVKVTRDES